MNPAEFWIVVTAAGAVLLYHLWSRRGERAPAAPLGDAFRAPQDATAEELARSCQACERLVERDPKDHAALAAWGRALYYLCESASTVAEKDRLCARAQEKHEAALALEPHNGAYAVGLASALVGRAIVQRGNQAVSWSMKACELCQKVVADNPRDEYALRCWACALYRLALTVPDAEADSILAQAEEKSLAALENHPTNGWSVSALASVLAQRARLHQGEERSRFILRACDRVQQALRLPDGNEWGVLSIWAYVLFARNKYMPGDETDRLLAEADRMFEAALQAGAERAALIGGWGVVHWARGLLQRAEEELMEDAARDPGPSAYNVACICAKRGEVDECRRWLEQSQEPGGCVSRDQMATERELESVRDCDWFRAILRAETPGSSPPHAG